MHSNAQHFLPSRPLMSSQVELKVHEINKRLKQRPSYPDSWWWEQFAVEFFDDNATLTISFFTESEGERNFSKFRWQIVK